MIVERDIKVSKMTRGLAIEFASMQSWKGERPLSEVRLTHLRAALAAGSFDSPIWARATFKGKAIRMNGQHSSVLLAGTEEKDIPKGMRAIIKEYDVDTQAELGELFLRFDHPAGVRHPREQLAALVVAANVVKTADVMKEREGIHRIASGMMWVRGQFTSKYATAIDRSLVLSEYPDFSDFALQFSRHSQLRRPPCLAAIFSTWLIAKRDAQAFWTAARDESDPPDSATRLLMRTLREVQGKGSSLAVAREVYCKCIQAWNGWRADERMVRLYYRPGAPMPEAV